MTPENLYQAVKHHICSCTFYSNQVAVLMMCQKWVWYFIPGCLHVLIALLIHWCLSSKRKDSEPGTKSLLSNAEMMAHHPTDPVEMRRINFQTPGMRRVPTQTPKSTFCIFLIKYTSTCSSSDNQIFMLLILTSVRLCRQDCESTPPHHNQHVPGSFQSFLGAKWPLPR